MDSPETVREHARIRVAHDALTAAARTWDRTDQYDESRELPVPEYDPTARFEQDKQRLSGQIDVLSVLFPNSTPEDIREMLEVERRRMRAHRDWKKLSDDGVAKVVDLRDAKTWAL